ncbi:MAG: type II toxin-antitoxin system VapC family toxin [Actinobacteria bacterium]|nr:type II toxin-antitoxin system VapC family toxin [Actinomycetota bacterium]
MRLLLDSHALLWVLRDDRRLNRDARAAIEEPDNHVAISAVSIWEIEIKLASGKLKIEVELLDEVIRVGYSLLAIVPQHGIAAARLPLHHRDPFDRMLIAQAQLEGLTIVTRDPRFAPYSVATMPA